MDVEWCFAPAGGGLVLVVGDGEFGAGAGDFGEGFGAELEGDSCLDREEVERDALDGDVGCELHGLAFAG